MPLHLEVQILPDHLSLLVDQADQSIKLISILTLSFLFHHFNISLLLEETEENVKNDGKEK